MTPEEIAKFDDLMRQARATSHVVNSCISLLCTLDDREQTREAFRMITRLVQEHLGDENPDAGKITYVSGKP